MGKRFFNPADDTGQVLMAAFSIELYATKMTIILESKGGRAKGKKERNPDYNHGLRLILHRLADLELGIEDILLDSKVVQSLPVAGRRLVITAFPYPIYPAEVKSIDLLRKAICKSQQSTARVPNAKGSGNSQKRIRIFLDCDGQYFDESQLGEILAGWAGPNEKQGVQGLFDPRDHKDARNKTIATIVRRQGQPVFRAILMECYLGKCAITGTNAPAALEAAHIMPYKGTKTNHISNGLLLRADIHTLFDRGLISIDPQRWTVVISKTLEGTTYEDLNGKNVNLPSNSENWPSKDAIRMRNEGLGF